MACIIGAVSGAVWLDSDRSVMYGRLTVRAVCGFQECRCSKVKACAAGLRGRG
jgi:hypothetical protein